MAPAIEYTIGALGTAKANASRNISDADHIVIFNTDGQGGGRLDACVPEMVA